MAKAQPFSALKPALVVSLLRDIPVTKMKCAAITGTLGERIAEAKEKFGLHPKALKEVARQLAMSEDARNDYQRSVELYMDYAREAGLLDEHHGDMMDEETGAGDYVDENALA
jgi:predicted RNA polymerase sigma factor